MKASFWVVHLMKDGTVFKNNNTQAIRLPLDARFPESVKKVHVRIVGQDRVLSPANKTWDSFFLGDQRVSEDFLTERASQHQAEREGF